MSGSCVELWRGPLVESRHAVSVAVMTADGELRAFSGDAEVAVVARSSVKPVQAVPLVEDDVMERFGLTSAELALACGSHSGEPRHVDTARSLLSKIGVDETSLACGPHEPFNETAARQLRDRGIAPGRVHNNCSGKHAGMLALAQANGWPLSGYHEEEHPVQRRMLHEVARWSGVALDDILVAVDGCGVLTFALPLSGLALAFARLARDARRGGTPAARVVHAMTTHPELVGGTDRLCTQLMRVTSGRIFLKVGAEGIYCAGAPGAELGIALKVADGAARATGPAIVAVLGRLGLITDEEIAALDHFAHPVVSNTRHEEVGRLRADIELETPGG